MIVGSELLVIVGLCSVALGGISGFALLAAVDAPESLRRLGVVDPRRVQQLHLDWIIMGCVIGFVGLAVPTLPDWLSIPAALGGIINPLTFLPMAFSKSIAATGWFKLVSFVSFCSLCLGLVGACVWQIATLVG
ncbi:hypothetical protein EDF60_2840 [Leucobacter luti]|uniref:hypothetical protein n=1 Tax=Leucobacter luti TaxID=340320 RepID=UPI00104B17FD|nr:hypothetical protein [Leucobacter luti]MCW2289138.1 hydroxylaminobenzene mutase [Leucobacter luti]TCK35465.1 hypothetical protein EDF60_2840 [Leucobacter luti]